MELTLTEAQIKELIRSFGISEDEPVTWLYKNVWDIGDRFILKQCPAPDEFNKSLWFSSYLAEKNIPVRQYLKTTEGQYLLYMNGIGYSLMSKIKGSHIDPFVRNCRETGSRLGQIIAELHQALKEAEPPFELYNSDSIGELSGWITDELKRSSIHICDDVIKACLSASPLYEKLPRQIIHRDMHLQNLVFEGDDFAGYLDFDISQKNVRIFDLCYLGSSMLVGNYADEERFKIWQDVFKNILRGYDEILHLTKDEKVMIPLMIIMIELTFTAWYSKLGQSKLVQSCVEMTTWSFDNLIQIKNAVLKLS